MPGTKATGLGDNFYVQGLNLSGDVSALSSIHGGPVALDFTTIQDSAYERQGGLRDGGMDFTSFFDPYGVGVPAGMYLLPTSDVVGSYFHGQVMGNDAASMNAKQLNWDGTRGTDGSFTFACSMQSNGFGLEWGTQITPGIRTDTTATAASSANSLDTGGPLSFGGQAYLQVFSVTGTSVTVTIWDSADNVTFTAVAGLAFPATTPVIAPEGYRLAIGNTATIRRYVAVATTGTFSNAQFAVQLTKNQTAGQIF